jgi:hypothetical protein
MEPRAEIIDRPGLSRVDGNETYDGRFDDLANILGINPPIALAAIVTDAIDGTESSPYTVEQFTTIY